MKSHLDVRRDVPSKSEGAAQTCTCVCASCSRADITDMQVSWVPNMAPVFSLCKLAEEPKPTPLIHPWPVILQLPPNLLLLWPSVVIFTGKQPSSDCHLRALSHHNVSSKASY